MRILAVFAMLLVAGTLLVLPAQGDQANWNCNLKVYWGGLDGAPLDTSDYFGVQPSATDGYDLLDSKKPGEPFGDYVYAWFSHPTWGQGPIQSDWREALAEGTTKQWGIDPAVPIIPPTDYWGVKTNLNAGPDGCPDPCDFGTTYPVAASIYIAWEFGVTPTPPGPLPPDDYTFTIKYMGGLGAKAAGCAEEGVTVPANGTVWDMEITEYIRVPIWSIDFIPFNAQCTDLGSPDTAKFFFIVNNPEAAGPTCEITVDPAGPQQAPATFAFTATGSGGTGPYTFDWDFGDGGSDSGSPVSHTYPSDGTYTVTCTVTDDQAATGTCTATAEVTPANEPPTCSITSAPAGPTTDDVITFNANASDSDGSVVSWAWDFGDTGTGSGDPATHQYASAGSYTVTCTVTDDDGATGSCTADVTVAEPTNEPPNCCIEMSAGGSECPLLVSFTDCSSDPDGTITSWLWDFGDGGSSTDQDTSHEYAPAGSYTVTLTVTDDDGASTSCTSSVTVVDTIAPEIICPADIVVDNDPGECGAVVTFSSCTATDTCDPSPICSCDPPSGSFFPVDTTEVTCTAEDASGNTATCTFTVTVNDAEPPTITCPADVEVCNDAGVCEATGVDLGTATADDNCPGLVVNDNAPAVFLLGTTVVTYTATDAAGNQTSCEQSVTVLDCEDPVITCPSDVSVESCEPTVVEIGTATASDNCDPPLVTNNAPTTFPVGTTVVTWTATDDAGNPASCTQNVVVTCPTNEPPTCSITYAPSDPTTDDVITFNANASDTDGTVVAWAWDFGDGGTASGDPATYQYASAGTYTVSCVVTDDGDATGTCTTTVTVAGVDDTPPVITCPDPGPYSVGGECTAPCPAATATDNVDPAPVVTQDPAAGTPLAPGAYTISVTATDASGNSSTADCPITVVDDTPPVIGCPPDITDACTDPGVCEAVVSLGAANASDNCGVHSLVNDAPGVFPVGTTAVTWTACDAAGNCASCTQNVTVNDCEPPSITCPNDLTAESCEPIALDIGTATADDNCGVASLTNDAPATFPVGTTQVTWTATDDAGNTASCTQAVTVICPTNEPPTCNITYTPADPTTDDTIAFDSGAADPDGTIVSVDWDLGDGTTASGDPAAHQYAMPGTYVVTVTVCDDGALCTTCTREVEVAKGTNIPPVCEVTYEPADPRPGEDVTFSANAYDPNPWGEIVSCEWQFGDGSPVVVECDPVHMYAEAGTYTVCVTVTDDQGGAATCCADVTVREVVCECDVAIDELECIMPAAGHVGQCKVGKIGARNMSPTEACDVWLRLTDNTGTGIFYATATIPPLGVVRFRIPHCYTQGEVGKHPWTWEVWPVDCDERTPWDNVLERRVNVHP